MNGVDQSHTDELIRSAREGDQAAYDRLFVRAGPKVWIYIRCRLGGRLAQELEPSDVLQETYLEAHRSFARFKHRGEGSFTRWLCCIAEYRIRDLSDHHQAQKRRCPGERVRSPSALGQIQDDRTGVSSVACRNEDTESLVDALLQLDPRERQAVLLRFFQEQTFAQVAQELRTSERSVRRLLGKALARMGEQLQQLGSVAG